MISINKCKHCSRPSQTYLFYPNLRVMNCYCSGHGPELCDIKPPMESVTKEEAEMIQMMYA